MRGALLDEVLPRVAEIVADVRARGDAGRGEEVPVHAADNAARTGKVAALSRAWR